MIVYVRVGCALQRPPKVDEYRRIAVWVPTPEGLDDFDRMETEASLVAAQIAESHGCVMAVETTIDRIE